MVSLNKFGKLSTCGLRWLSVTCFRGVNSQNYQYSQGFPKTVMHFKKDVECGNYWMFDLEENLWCWKSVTTITKKGSWKRVMIFELFSTKPYFPDFFTCFHIDLESSWESRIVTKRVDCCLKLKILILSNTLLGCSFIHFKQLQYL